MATVAQLKTEGDNLITQLTTDIAALQTSYNTTNGKYWQGLCQPHPPINDGTATAPDKSRKPTDQTEDWTDFGVALPATQKVSIGVDQYDGPSGRGYVIHAVFKKGANIYRKDVNTVGGESHLTQDWRIINGTIS